MKKSSVLVILAAALFASGCAAFRSGETAVARNELEALLADKTVRPFAEIKGTWKNFPYKSAIDIIGEGTVSGPPKPTSVPVPQEDLDSFLARAKKVLAEAGLYSPDKGSGTLELEMTTINRWSYKQLWRGYMVDTAFIFIVPSSLKTGYHLSAAFRPPAGAEVKTEGTAQRKTVFHILLAPLYPLFAPGASESGILNTLLWKASTDIYGKIKLPKASPSPAAPAAAPAQETALPAIPEPPAAPVQPEPAAAPVPAAPAPDTVIKQAPETAPAADD